MKTTCNENGDCVTTYENEDGCGGCKVNGPGSIACDDCFDPKTGEYRNFQPDKEYYKKI